MGAGNRGMTATPTAVGQVSGKVFPPGEKTIVIEKVWANFTSIPPHLPCQSWEGINISCSLSCDAGGIGIHGDKANERCAAAPPPS